MTAHRCASDVHKLAETVTRTFRVLGRAQVNSKTPRPPRSAEAGELEVTNQLRRYRVDRGPPVREGIARSTAGGEGQRERRPGAVRVLDVVGREVELSVSEHRGTVVTPARPGRTKIVRVLAEAVLGRLAQVGDVDDRVAEAVAVAGAVAVTATVAVTVAVQRGVGAAGIKPPLSAPVGPPLPDRVKSIMAPDQSPAATEGISMSSCAAETYP